MLHAKKVIYEGFLQVGNGGKGIKQGKDGDGGTLALITDVFAKNTEGGLHGGNGGLGGGIGGNGGDAFLGCDGGTNGNNSSGTGTITGGNGGDGGNGGYEPPVYSACGGGAGGTATSTNGDANGGSGGHGGHGITLSVNATGGGTKLGPGGSGGRGGSGGNANAGNGGNGTGGNGGNGGNGSIGGDAYFNSSCNCGNGAESGGTGGDGGSGGLGVGGGGFNGGVGKGGSGGNGGSGSRGGNGATLPNNGRSDSGNGGEGGSGGRGGAAVGGSGGGGDGGNAYGGNGGSGSNGGSGGFSNGLNAQDGYAGKGGHGGHAGSAGGGSAYWYNNNGNGGNAQSGTSGVGGVKGAGPNTSNCNLTQSSSGSGGDAGGGDGGNSECGTGGRGGIATVGARAMPAYSGDCLTSYTNGIAHNGTDGTNGSTNCSTTYGPNSRCINGGCQAITSYTWVGGNGLLPTDGSWSVAANWSPASVPSANAAVTIPSGTVVLDGNYKIYKLTMGGTAAALVGANTLTCQELDLMQGSVSTNLVNNNSQSTTPVTNNTTLAPGTTSAVGTMTLNPSVILGSTSILDMKVIGNQADRVSTAGAITYNGTLRIRFINQVPPGTYTIVVAGSGSGNFTSIEFAKGASGAFSPTPPAGVTVNVTLGLLAGSSVEVVVSSPLPIELLSFQAQNKDASNKLSWQTATEKNVRDFDVEKSSDGKTFEKIGTVKAKGNSNTPQYYALSDDTPFDLTYYRLKINDLDNKNSYSKTLSVSQKGKLVIKIYPNPAKDNATIDLGEAENATIRLIDILGKEMLQQSGQSRQVLLNLSSLPNGVYFVEIKVKSVVVREKFIKN